MAAAVIARRRGWRNLVSMSIQVREMSERVQQNANGRKEFLVDTLSMVRKLEGQDIPSKHAESEMFQDFNMSRFKSEVQTSLGHHISSLQREFEKLGVDIEKMQTERRVNIEKMQNEFRVNIEKLQNEIKYEFDKLNAGRLDLNLERWRSRDELAKQGAETSELFDKLDREIHALKAQIETTKYEAIMYGIGTLVSLSVVSLAVIRMLI